jgi:cyclase
MPVLLLQNRGLVKTTKFNDPRYLGDPHNAVRIFNEKEVDEIVVLDIGASRDSRDPDFDFIRGIAAECFMPLAYGGGIRDADHARRLFSIGVERVVLRTSALVNPRIVSEIASFAGSSSVAVAIDVHQTRLGRYRLVAPGTSLDGSSDWMEEMTRLVDAGAGEVLLNSVNRDGTMAGMDTDLIRLASDRLSVPLVAVGGVGALADIKKGVEAGASAIGAGSFFVYHGPRRAVLITYPSYQELSDLLGSI